MCIDCQLRLDGREGGERVSGCVGHQHPDNSLVPCRQQPQADLSISPGESFHRTRLPVMCILCMYIK